MHTIFADSGYQGREKPTLLNFGWLLNIPKKPRKKKGIKATFQVLSKRWIVERTFAWLGIFRRLAVDFETSPRMAEAFIQVASIVIALKKLE